MNIKTKEFALIVVKECIKWGHIQREIMAMPSDYEEYLEKDFDLWTEEEKIKKAELKKYFHFESIRKKGLSKQNRLFRDQEYMLPDFHIGYGLKRKTEEEQIKEGCFQKKTKMS